MLSRKSLMLRPCCFEATLCISSTPSLRTFAGVHHEVAAATAAPHTEQHAVTFDFLAAFHRFVGAVYALAIDFENDIARTLPRRSRGRSRINVHNECALNLVGNVELPAVTRVEVLDDDAVQRIGLRA